MKKKLITFMLCIVALVAFALVTDAFTASMTAPFVLYGLGVVYSEGNYLGDAILQEAEKRASREEVTIITGQNLAIAAVIGKITKALGSITADGGNTGDGTVTGGALGAKALLGTYTLECVVAAANGGTFKVVAPDGDALPDAEVGTAYINQQINFTINDGAADFIVGDKFTFDVDAGSGKGTELDPSAVDGSQNAHGILIYAINATAADVNGVAIVRDAIAIDYGLAWPGAITQAEKDAALAELEARHITVRKGV